MSQGKRSSSNHRARKWGAKVHSINTIDTANFGSNNDSPTASSTFRIQQIPTLPNNEYAASLLRRIQDEFGLIVEKRGYCLTTVTEMCCCGDGLDHLNSTSSSQSGGKRGRKTRKMPNNVLGYNFTQGTSRSRNSSNRSVHRIHLRLRHPTKHTFYSYEDIAGTMCHELAHCERGPHDASFYKLMDEIIEQHAVYMVKGMVLDKSGFPLGDDSAHVLGGGSGGPGTIHGRSVREKAAVKRIQMTGQMGGTFRLGGGFMPGSQSVSSLAHLPSSEAARLAAERRVEERRRNDSQFCLPCREIIEILDGSSSENDDGDGDGDDEGLGEKRVLVKKHNPAKAKKMKSNEAIIIDIDSSSDEELRNNPPNLNPVKKRTSKRIIAPESISMIPVSDLQHSSQESSDSSVECSSWSCSKCTYNNNPSSLACEVCGNIQNGKQKTIRNDKIEEVKKNEVEASKLEFGGFNIYGNEKRSSGTLGHLT